MQNKYTNNYPVINLYRKKSIFSELVTQMLCGENFTIISKYKSWYKIKLHTDKYVGFVKKKKFSKPFKTTHKVSVLAASIYRKPFNKSKSKKKLPFSSKIFIKEKKGSFLKFQNYWIKSNDLKKISYKDKKI